MTPLEKITRDSEIERYRLIGRLNDIISANFYAAIDYIAGFVGTRQIEPNLVFSYKNYPVVKQFIDNAVKELAIKAEVQVLNAVKMTWASSNSKNDLINVEYLPKSIVNYKKFYNNNTKALDAYLKQLETNKGLKLSDRIYKTTDVFVHQLEEGLAKGLAKGKSARELGRDLKQNLKNPQGSQEVGQGVYRSATANIERLTKTVINSAYRSADRERWMQNPFILGFQVNLSANHPKYDICDSMAGRYPSSFVFVGWHPNCLCYLIPVLMNTEQFTAYQELVKKDSDTPENVAKIVAPVVDLPEGAKKWVQDNLERMSKWKNEPYFLKDNKQAFGLD